MSVKKTIITTVSIVLGLALLSNGLSAYAANRTAVSKLDKNVTFTVTDKPCEFFAGIPDGAPIVAASAYDAKANLTIVGCALDYGTQIEFQLVNEAEKKHYQFVLPSEDFHVVDPI
jgi:hypothetical protein